jgi:hypothetical protein
LLRDAEAKFVGDARGDFSQQGRGSRVAEVCDQALQARPLGLQFGGIGIAEKGFELIEPLWEATLKTISECPCDEGCPSCIQSPKCGNNNEPLDKKASRILLEGLLGYVKLK